MLSLEMEKCYDEIADRLDIAERTVKYHVSNILSKTGYANRTRLPLKSG